MAQRTTKNGYVQDKKEHSDLYHRKIAHQFIYKRFPEMFSLPFSKYEVHHIDGNKKNNLVSNLALLTPEEHLKLHQKIMKNQQKGMDNSEAYIEPYYDIIGKKHDRYLNENQIYSIDENFFSFDAFYHYNSYSKEAKKIISKFLLSDDAISYERFLKSMREDDITGEDIDEEKAQEIIENALSYHVKKENQLEEQKRRMEKNEALRLQRLKVMKKNKFSIRLLKGVLAFFIASFTLPIVFEIISRFIPGFTFLWYEIIFFIVQWIVPILLGLFFLFHKEKIPN